MLRKLTPLRAMSAALLLTSWFAPLFAAELYVTPGATSSVCSESLPCPLEFAIGEGSPARPGDTIWLGGGTYRGTYTSWINGTSSAPIIIRQRPGQRATLDGGSSTQAVLQISGNYVWLWGFEVMNSDPKRQTSDSGPWPTDLRRGALATDQQANRSVGVKFINLVIHDLKGFFIWKEAVGAEVYGNLVYYIGWEGPDDGHGHGIYTQNQDGTMFFSDNIIFRNFSHGFHAYTEGAYINNLRLEGNTIFDNDSLSDHGARNLLIGGAQTAKDPVLINNYIYYPDTNPGTIAKLGYAAPVSNAVLKGNYFVTGNATALDVNASGLTMSNNVLYGHLQGVSQSSYPNNTYHGVTRPTGVSTFVRPNRYEPGRANITVFNWNRNSSVTVDPRPILNAGDSFEIRDAENFYGAPVVSGKYSGGTINLPMNQTAVAPAIGNVPNPPRHSSSEFGVFVLLRTAGSATSNEAPTVSAGPDKTVNVDASAVLAGSASDDGLPSNTLAVKWTKVSGPGTVSISNSANASTNATFSASGSYVLRLSADDSSLTSSDDVAVTVQPSSSPTNQAPELSILSPTDGSRVPAGSTVTFRGAANDSEDGNISSELVWRSNVDGAIGVGASLNKTLSVGPHTITASITDAAGATSKRSVAVTVEGGDSVSVSKLTVTLEAGRARRVVGEATMRIVDATGDPVSGAAVTAHWTKNGRVYRDAGRVQTDANGVARTSLTLRAKYGDEIRFVITGIESDAATGTFEPVSAIGSWK